MKYLLLLIFGLIALNAVYTAPVEEDLDEYDIADELENTPDDDDDIEDEVNDEDDEDEDENELEDPHRRKYKRVCLKRCYYRRRKWYLPKRKVCSKTKKCYYIPYRSWKRSLKSKLKKGYRKIKKFFG